MYIYVYIYILVRMGNNLFSHTGNTSLIPLLYAYKHSPAYIHIYRSSGSCGQVSLRSSGHHGPTGIGGGSWGYRCKGCYRSRRTSREQGQGRT